MFQLYGFYCSTVGARYLLCSPSQTKSKASFERTIRGRACTAEVWLPSFSFLQIVVGLLFLAGGRGGPS